MTDITTNSGSNRSRCCFRTLTKSVVETSKEHHMVTSAKHFALLALLLTAAALIYWPGLSGPFLLDDASNLPEARIEALTATELRQQLFALNWPYPAVRGLGRVSFALSDWFIGGAPRDYKLVNLALHLVNGLLIFWLLRSWLQRRPVRGIDMPPYWLALTVTGFWLLHPLQVSSVLYAVQRFALLASLFSLLALVSYTQGRFMAERRPWLGCIIATLGVGTFTLLGLLSKETAALTPLMILLVEHFFFGWQFRTTDSSRLPRRLFPTLVLLPLAVGALFAFTHMDGLTGGYDHRPFTMAQRLMTQAHVLGLYLQQIMVPLPATMSLFHEDFPVTRAMDLSTLGLAACYVIAILTALALRVRAPWVGFAILWFFVCHLLESSFLSLELVFEHRNYLALLGPAILVVLGLGKLLDPRALRRLRLPILVSVLGLLSFNTAARVFVWSDESLLYHSEYAARPGSQRVLAGLINLSYNQGDTALAGRYADELAATGTTSAAPHLVKLLLSCQSQPADPAQLENAVRKLQARADDHFAIHVLGALLTAYVEGKCPTLEAAELNALLHAAYAGSSSSIPHHCATAETLALFQVNERGLAASHSVVRQAIIDCSATPAGSYHALLRNLSILAANREFLNEMVEFILSTTADSDRPVAPSDLPVWVQRQLNQDMAGQNTKEAIHQ